jgi:hypothetical protein
MPQRDEDNDEGDAMNIKWVIRIAFYSLFLLLFFYSVSHADTYKNCSVSEPAIHDSIHTLWCDDFEDGDMLYDETGTAKAENDGWLLFNDPYPLAGGNFPDSGGHGFGRCGTTTGNALVVGDTPGAAGTNGAASTGLVMGREGSTPSSSDHDFSSPITAGQDVYLRYYKKCVRVGGCNWSVNTKLGPIVNRSAGWGGIDFGVPQASAAEVQFPCPTNSGNSGCPLAIHEFHVPLNFRVLTQNQGTNDGSCASGHTCWEDGTRVGQW